MYGHYQILRKVGAGGFGTVYQARDCRTGTVVAIKVLNSAVHLERFRREIELLYAQDATPNVVQVLDWDLDCPHPYLVTEFCDGGSLRQWVGHVPGWDWVTQAIRDAASGLASIHARSGFHRDIKPDNLLLWRLPPSQVNRVKVADFGLANCPQLHEANITRTALGTEGYMAPELLQGAPYGTKADIYSLGMTAVELLSGARDPRWLSNAPLPNELRKILLRMLAPNPLARLSAIEVSRLLDALLQRAAAGKIGEEERTSDLSGLVVIGGLLLGAAALWG